MEKLDDYANKHNLKYSIFKFNSNYKGYYGVINDNFSFKSKYLEGFKTLNELIESMVKNPQNHIMTYELEDTYEEMFQQELDNENRIFELKLSWAEKLGLIKLP